MCFRSVENDLSTLGKSGIDNDLNGKRKRNMKTEQSDCMRCQSNESV